MIREVEKMDDVHENTWELLPWYINGTLEAGERNLVERHLQTCARCQKEYTAQKRLAVAFSEREDFDAVEERNWSLLSEKIAPTQPINLAAERAKRTFSKLWAPSALMAASLAFIVFVGPNIIPQDNEFRTLTNGENVVGEFLRVKAAGDVDEAAMRALFSENDLRLINGPSSTGVYTVQPTSKTDLSRAFERMTNTEQVVFVSKVQGN